MGEWDGANAILAEYNFNVYMLSKQELQLQVLSVIHVFSKQQKIKIVCIELEQTKIRRVTSVYWFKR